MGGMYDVPSNYRLDDRQQEIIGVIADGSALKPRPRPGDILRARMTQAQLIVRATLLAVDPDGSKWRITRALSGDARPQVLRLDNEFFGLRA